MIYLSDTINENDKPISPESIYKNKPEVIYYRYEKYKASRFYRNEIIIKGIYHHWKEVFYDGHLDNDYFFIIRNWRGS